MQVINLVEEPAACIYTCMHALETSLGKVFTHVYTVYIQILAGCIFHKCPLPDNFRMLISQSPKLFVNSSLSMEDVNA